MPTFKRSTDDSSNGRLSTNHLNGCELDGAEPTGSEGTGPVALRPYLWLGMDLSVKDSQANGDCPFCGKEGKFTVSVENGLWRCFTCGEGNENGGGNALMFLRLLHALGTEQSDEEFLDAVAKDRGLCNRATVKMWGIVRNPLPPHNWLVPGYNVDGKLHQLYRQADIEGHRRYIPTPGIWPKGRSHALHLPLDRNPTNPIVYICEGPWDGMALWEVAHGSTSECQIIAVPGCNVWQDAWTQLCDGKQVVLLFDSDYPRQVGSKTFRAGYDGMRRVAKRLSGRAAAVKWLRWGPDGFDPNKPDGWDLRDALSGSLSARRVIMNGLMTTQLADAPPEWFTVAGTPGHTNGANSRGIEPQDCNKWSTCESAWKEAMRWRDTLSDALTVLLAVCASTNQAGNQLFVDLVGSAGSGKTTICEGLLVSHHCHHLEHLTGFHSGFKKPDDNTKDCSLIARVNGKTMITPEFDLMRTSPRYAELMGQVRRIFDGKSGATYKNSDEDTLYVGLRTPWIRAGTFAMMDTDQSQLGDRFLRFIIEDPSETEKRNILYSALRSERTALMDQANGTAGSIVDHNTRVAYALTGGYVDWLRANVEDALALIDVPADCEDRCIDLAELAADLRARPNEDKHKKENHDRKELPTRLARQNIRLAMHVAVVLNKRKLDAEVLRIVRKVALDTSYGHSLNIVKWLVGRNHKLPSKSYQSTGGLGTKVLSQWLNMPLDRLENYLTFLRRIDVLQMRTKHGSNMWLLTDRMYDLFLRIMKG